MSNQRNHRRRRRSLSRSALFLCLLIGLFIMVGVENHLKLPTGEKTTGKDGELISSADKTSIGTAYEVDDDQMPSQSQSSSTDPTFDAPCSGKETLVKILQNVNITVDNDLCRQLPAWKTIVNLYGDKPIVVGMETCEAYRRQSSKNPKPRVAGLYNSGTNALAWMLIDNIIEDENNDINLSAASKDGLGMQHPYEVPWQKHNPSKMRLDWKFPSDNPESPKDVLPIVIIRDPYRWMVAMCRKAYFASWRSSSDGHCPTLSMLGNNRTGNPVSVRPPPDEGIPQEYKSLADWWSEWYRAYYYSDADFPRLMVRFEDLLFHPEQVFDAIANCSGISSPQEEGTSTSTRTRQTFQYHMSAAKSHGAASHDMVQAMIKYGQERGRTKGFQDADLDYARKKHSLDADLMKAFHYTHPTPPRDYHNPIP